MPGQGSDISSTEMDNEVVVLSDEGEESHGGKSSAKADSNGDAQAEEDVGFSIDTEGYSGGEEENPAFSTRQESYGPDFPLPNGQSRRKGTCFNCGGDHILAACTEKRDIRRIARNRNSFRGSYENNMARFHEQDNSGDVRPGVISRELRKALGIGPRDIPEWIFRMRKKGFVDGYPPAYLRRAVERHTIPFFVDPEDEEKTQQGEETIDPLQMVLYPGFNYYDRSLDDPERFRIPPWEKFVECHQVALNEEKRRTAEGTNSRKRKSLGDGETVERKKKKKEKGGQRSETPEEGEVVEEDSKVSEEGDETPASGKSTPNQTGDLPECETSVITTTTLDISSTPGTSTPVIQGTPVLLRRHAQSDKYTHEIPTPSLESFAKGINPYRYQEEESKEQSGFFKKVGGVLKNKPKSKVSKK